MKRQDGPDYQVYDILTAQCGEAKFQHPLIRKILGENDMYSRVNKGFYDKDLLLLRGRSDSGEMFHATIHAWCKGSDIKIWKGGQKEFPVHFSDLWMGIEMIFKEDFYTYFDPNKKENMGFSQFCFEQAELSQKFTEASENGSLTVSPDVGICEDADGNWSWST